MPEKKTAENMDFKTIVERVPGEKIGVRGMAGIEKRIGLEETEIKTEEQIGVMIRKRGETRIGGMMRTERGTKSGDVVSAVEAGIEKRIRIETGTGAIRRTENGKSKLHGHGLADIN